MVRERILVVENNAEVLNPVVAFLSDSYHITTAADIPDALAILATERVDLVLLDLILPSGTGFDVLNDLTRRGQVVPVLVMSGLGTQVDLSRYSELVAGQIDKPFDLNELKTRIREIRRGERHREVPMPGEKAAVLLVDDDVDMLQAAADYLRVAGYTVRAAPSGDEALKAVAAGHADVVVTDWIMPGFTGLELLHRLKALVPETPVILMTGYGTPDFSRKATAAGAADVLIKPFAPRALPLAIEKCLQRAAGKLLTEPGPELRRHEPSAAGHEGAAQYTLSDLIGNSLAMQRLRHWIVAVAATDSSVLILGETGTGKELVAHAIHARSARSGKPFVIVNAAAIPETLLEAELFGYAGGAFTGAQREGRVGKFQKADGGTLFLDEIGDLPSSLQAKLLRVLQSGEVDVVGGATRQLDVRFVAATNRDLREMAANGSFRNDLFFRLNIVTLQLPPIRERREDIPVLVAHFLQELCNRYHRPDMSMSGEALDRLMAYDWPGNVRELRNVVERTFVFSAGPRILPSHLPPELRSAGGTLTPAVVGLATQERLAIVKALETAGGNKKKAAELLGISRSGLYMKLKAYELE
ncbi:MAG TPA: sigma-54-dependent Fis family transcriptional regulator [Symbiobacteriaceae bacterium]|jgi:DNA-binding NtrC family response regulator